MRITYDPEADAAYIYVVPHIGAGQAAQQVSGITAPNGTSELNIDFDVDGMLLGLEVLDASQCLSAAVLASAPPPRPSWPTRLTTAEVVNLDTPRLHLREMTEDDLPALRAILQDDETMTAYEGAFDEAMTQQWFDRMRNRYRTDGFGMWAVELRETHQMIGQCGLTIQHILDEDVVEVGYLFNRVYWHHGYAVEAARACRDYAFAQLGVQRVWAQVRDTNLASMNVAIRLGMTVRGRFVKHYRGVDMPHLAFAMDKLSPQRD